MKRILAFLFLVFPLLTNAQIGGTAVNTVLDIPASARVAALGGNQIAVVDNDLNLAIYNPALLNPLMRDQVTLSYLNWFSDINLGNVSYGKHLDSLNTTIAGTVQFIDYGSFVRTDPVGAELGTFKVGEYVGSFSAAQRIDSLFRIGASLKYIYSAFDSFTSSAVALDVGGVYQHPNKLLTIAVLMRNIGYQFDSFNDTREALPFQAQLGLTYKFKHAPFRLGLIFENLQKWDLTFVDSNQPVQIDPNTGLVIAETFNFTDKLLRHIILNNEIIFGKNFMVRLGYNFRRRAELAFDTKPAAVGLSYGLGMRLSKFHLSYGRASYHLGGVSNTFSVALRFSDFKQPVSN